MLCRISRVVKISMGYVDRFYFGQNLLIVNTTADSVTAENDRASWSATPINGVATMLVPNCGEYTITAGDKEVTVFVGYGQCKQINL